MKLPEITQEILDEFINNFCDEEGLVVGGDGDGDPYNSQLIEWVDKKPQWTQTAVDFARLIAQEVAELEAENKQLKEWAGRSLVMSDYPNAEAMRTEIESMRPVMEAAKRHAKYNELIGKSFCTCDICKSYRDYEDKKP